MRLTLNTKHSSSFLGGGPYSDVRAKEVRLYKRRQERRRSTRVRFWTEV